MIPKTKNPVEGYIFSSIELFYLIIFDVKALSKKIREEELLKSALIASVMALGLLFILNIVISNIVFLLFESEGNITLLSLILGNILLILYYLFVVLFGYCSWVLFDSVIHHFLFKLFGGTGTLKKLATYNILYFSAILCMGVAISWIPISEGISNLLILPVGIFFLIQKVRAAKVIYNLPAGKVITAILIPIAVAIILGVGLAFLFSFM